MLFYFSITTFSVLLGCFFPNAKTNKLHKILYLLTVFSVLIIFMGLRGRSVGVDTAVSNDFYTRIAQENEFSVYMNIVNAAPVYSFYNKILSFFSSNPVFLNLVNAVIINACFAYFIYKYSENTVFSVYCYITMYFYLFSFNGTRQSLAGSLCLLAFCLLKNKKPVLSLLTFVAAFGMHMTCIVFFPMYILCSDRLKISTYQLILLSIGVGCIILRFTYKPFLSMVFRIMPAYQKYGNWLEDGRFQAQGRNILVTVFYTIFIILFIAMIWKQRNSTTAKQKQYWQLIIPAVFGLMLGLVFYKNALISGRVILYFTCFMIVVLPNFIEQFARGKILPYTVIGFCLMFLLYYQLRINYAGIMPYMFFWQ